MCGSHESFDFIFNFQVFEHLPEPRPVLEKFLFLLKPDGLALIHTDMELPEREDGFEQWWYVLPPDHCSLFRHRTFEKLSEQMPFSLVLKDPKRIVIRKTG